MKKIIVVCIGCLVAVLMLGGCSSTYAKAKKVYKVGEVVVKNVASDKTKERLAPVDKVAKTYDSTRSGIGEALSEKKPLVDTSKVSNELFFVGGDE